MIHIWCLPGFLGKAGDWAPLESHLGGAGEILFHPLDLPASPGKIRPFPYWARKFNAGVPDSGGINVLAGYSLGGRLALHALLQPDAPWDGAVLISAHPGLSTEAERKARLASDEEWARRFEEEPWEHLLEEWNARPVFGGRPLPPRKEEEFSRPALAAILRTWSLGLQEPLWDRLHHIRIPVLWCAGAEDEKFLILGRRAVELLPKGTFRAVPGAAHRVHLEAPEPLAGFMEEFLALFQGRNGLTPR